MDDTTRNARSDGAGAPPNPLDSEQPGKRHGVLWKVLAVLGLAGAGCASVSLIMGALMAGVLSVGVVSCTNSCSDNPIGDTRADAAFIADRTATSRDLETFDALRSAIDTLCQRRAIGDDEQDPYDTDELRSEILQGTWPRDVDAGTAGSLSPQTWVRLAELGQTYLEDKTGERWEVVDFSYPFPNNGPIPWPATRDENNCTCTRLHCLAGEDEGLYASVYYYRWRRPAEYEDNLEEAREEREYRKGLLDEIDELGVLGSRDYVLSSGNLYVWATGADDELCDPERFLEVANQLMEGRGSYFHVTLLAADTPVYIGYESLSYDYPNNQELELMTYSQARKVLTDCAYIRYLDTAGADALLSGYRSDEEVPIVLEDLTGTLAPTPREDFRHPWHSPDEGSVFDESLAEEVAQCAGGIDQSQVIATSVIEESYGDESVDTWVILPRGTVPETPDGFCELANSLRDRVWDTYPLSGDRTSCYVHIYVIEPEGIEGPDQQQWSFAELREAVQDDPQVLGECSVDVALSAMPSRVKWDGYDDLHDGDCVPNDVGGSISYSRSWRYPQ